MFSLYHQGYFSVIKELFWRLSAVDFFLTLCVSLPRCDLRTLGEGRAGSSEAETTAPLLDSPADSTPGFPGVHRLFAASSWFLLNSVLISLRSHGGEADLIIVMVAGGSDYRLPPLLLAPLFCAIGAFQ